jgi:hypothetical protein
MPERSGLTLLALGLALLFPAVALKAAEVPHKTPAKQPTTLDKALTTEALAPPALAITVEFQFTLDKAGLTSAGLYDAEGRLVRTLWTMKELAASKQTGMWDGLDEFGQAAPAGEYEYRVVLNGSTYRNVGLIGNNGRPPDDKGHTPNGVQSLAVDAAGAVYSANGWDEAGADFKKWDADGNSVYDAQYQIRNGKPNGAPYSVATDAEYLYCGMGGWARAPFNSMQQVQRFRLADGKQEKFTETGRDDGHILVYEWPEKQVPEGTPEADAALMKSPLRALAITGETILVADALGGRVLKFHKAAGRVPGEAAARAHGGQVGADLGRARASHDQRVRGRRQGRPRGDQGCRRGRADLLWPQGRVVRRRRPRRAGEDLRRVGGRGPARPHLRPEGPGGRRRPRPILPLPRGRHGCGGEPFHGQ